MARVSRLLVVLLRLARFLPQSVLVLLARAAGLLVWRLVPERRRVTRANLAACFPAMPAAQLARAHFGAFCASFAAYGMLAGSSRARIERLVRIEGLEHLRALEGAPAILLAPHFIGLDVGFARLACEFDMVSMYANQKASSFAALLAQARTRFGDQRLVSRQEGIRAAISGLRAGRPFYYLPDQDHGPHDALFVPFFGVSAATVPGVARIAKLAGARVLPCVTRLLPGGRGWLVQIEPPWQDYPTHDLYADTRRMNAYIERRVNAFPEQYIWMHKRFKTRPPGEASLYGR
ncbi:MAG: lipid A biosynthesis acyltransferase [Proteobacteria bacterium]|nr:lipid A biosynthesis acyltransferase [Pseudomonadota bacterium]